MTTNTYDSNIRLFASDSRWSYETPRKNRIFYVDDTGYDKIVYDHQLTMSFAGDLLEVSLWKNWFMRGRINSEMPVYSDDVSISLADVDTGEVVPLGQVIEFEGAYFLGTGTDYAIKCWTTGRCVKKSIETASKSDPYTGGEIRYLCRTTNATNIATKTEAELVCTLLRERGMTMAINNSKSKDDNAPVSIKSAINDPEIKKDFDELISGGGRMCAPFAGMGRKRTQEEKDALYSALRKYAPQQ